MSIDLILGTAGHIDHGKTSLVKALTGIDTDRLPEEKARGITIELGFAELRLGEYCLGIVDVPGHERFVRNMLAGATGIDLAMLVVAADDSVKPQTREHLEILRLLDLDVGVIALTKCDLPKPDWIDLVEEEIRELVAETFLAQAPIVRCSAMTGQGLEELKTRLAAAADIAAAANRRRRLHAPFRMAIDRSFTIAGHGTVVTGSVSSGQAAVGDELVIEPGGVPVRVRGLRSFDRPVDEVHRGQRAAINLAGIHHDEIGRGQELAAAGHLAPSKLLTISFQALSALVKPVKNRTRVRVHVGTAELMATLVLLDRDEAAPGATDPAQLFLASPAVTTWGQALVVRSESPVQTIGGGHVLDPAAPRLKRRDERALAQLELLRSTDPIERAGAALYFAGWRDWRPEDLARSAAVDDIAAATEALARRGLMEEIPLSPTRVRRVHRLVREELAGRVEEALSRLHDEHPLRAMLERTMLAERFSYLDEPAILDAVIESLRRTKRIQVTDRGMSLAGKGPQLTQNEQKLVSQIIEMHRAAGYQPPTVAEVRSQVDKNQAAVPKLIQLAESEGRLVKISSEYHLHSDVERQLRERLAEPLSSGTGLTASQIKEILGTSRKYAVPICEYLDRVGFTRREGDLRFLATAPPQ